MMDCNKSQQKSRNLTRTGLEHLAISQIKPRSRPRGCLSIILLFVNCVHSTLKTRGQWRVEMAGSGRVMHNLDRLDPCGSLVMFEINARASLILA
jgi:hypothetical protein